MKNLQYFLDPKTSEVCSKEVSAEELRTIQTKLENGHAGALIRSCWLCNPSHSRFLEDHTDDHFFICFDCGRFFFNGMDVTPYDKPNN